MKRSKFIGEERIIGILRDQEAGTKTADICRRHDFPKAFLYKFTSNYDGTKISDARRAKALENETERLKHLLADTHPDIARVKSIHGEGHYDKKIMTPGTRRDSAPHLNEVHRVSKRRACRVIGATHSSPRHIGATLAAWSQGSRYVRPRFAHDGENFNRNSCTIRSGNIPLTNGINHPRRALIGA